MHTPYMQYYKKELMSLKCRPRPLFHLGPLDHATATTTTTTTIRSSSIRTILSRNRRRRSKPASFPRPNGRPSHHGPRYWFRTRANLDHSFPSRRVVEFVRTLFIRGGSFTVSCHLGFDFHAAVEFLFCHAALALRVAFFFDGVEDAT